MADVTIKMYIEDEEAFRKMRNVSEEILSAIEKSAKSRIVPVFRKSIHQEAPVLTGTLRDSIKPDVRRLSRGGSVLVTALPAKNTYRYDTVPYIDNARRKKKRFRKVRSLVKKNPAVKYMHFVEQGTKRGVKPNPFRSRALEKITSQVISIITESVKSSIK